MSILTLRLLKHSIVPLHMLLYMQLFAVAFAAEPQNKSWKSSDGKFGLVSATPNQVVLVKLDNQKHFEGTWLKMALSMRKEIGSYWSSQDNEQLDKVRSVLSTKEASLKDTHDKLRGLHGDYPMSPYAGLAIGVSQAALTNEHEKATVILKQVTLRLETQRGAIPEAHQNTLASCYCNLAICALKDKKPDIAMNFFVKSIDILPMPANIYNMHQLGSIGKRGDGYLKLTETQLLKLKKSLDGLPQPETNFPLGWHYSMAIDDGKQNKQFLVDQDGKAIETVPDTWCIPCDGKGFQRCPNCVKGVATYKDIDVKAFNPTTNSPIYGTTIKQKVCEACKGDGGFDCPFCERGRILR